MKKYSLTAMLAVAAAAFSAFAEPDVDVQHVKVHFEGGRFGGWPANHGMWNWGDEILVGYGWGYYKDQGSGRHHIDRDKPSAAMLARSMNGGLTWTHEEFPNLAEDISSESGGIDFTHPDFAMTVRTTDINKGKSFYYYSYDRGKTWIGPYDLPNFGAPGIAARTDYIVNGRDSCMLFLTASKDNEREGRLLSVETTDGAATWHLVGWIGPEPKGFAIMPSTVRLSERTLLSAVRRREGRKRWAESWISRDNGKYWTLYGTPTPDLGEGNPPMLMKLQDGRLCLHYGVREEPFRICAKLSSDDGKTWSDEIVLRDDGSSRDMGYTRAVQRPDGRVVVVYYFSDAETGPERYIGATIWDPTQVK